MSEKQMVTVRLSQEELTMLKRLALHRGTTMTSFIRMYIRNSYSKLPQEAK